MPTIFTAVLIPLLQAKVVPVVVDVAVNVVEVVAQVRIASGPAFALGGTVLDKTPATSEAVQPLFGSVINKV
jgi:hypothetical protein